MPSINQWSFFGCTVAIKLLPRAEGITFDNDLNKEYARDATIAHANFTFGTAYIKDAVDGGDIVVNVTDHRQWNSGQVVILNGPFYDDSTNRWYLKPQASVEDEVPSEPAKNLAGVEKDYQVML